MEKLKEKNQKQMIDKNINSDMSKDNELISKLKEIFNHFSNNSKYLSNKDYKLFLIETSLLDDFKITHEYSNILFYSFSTAKNCISFQSFCKLIIKIASIKFPVQFKENQEKALFLLYEVYLNPLIKIYQVINSSNKKKSELTKDDFILNNINNKLIIQKVVSRMTKGIIEKNYLLFLKIFQKYFCFENLKISNTQKNHLSQKAFCKILEEFNILPAYINSERAEKVYNIIIKNREYILNIMNNFINIDLCINDGMYFTLFHFIISIYLISIINIMITNYNENEPENIWEIFMNNNDSKTFEHLISLFYKSSKLKIIMNDELKKIQDEILNGQDEDCKDNNSENQLFSSFNNNFEENNKLSPITNKSQGIEKLYQDNISYSLLVPIILSKFKTQLISIYKYYSELFLETNFSVYMTQNGFINIIKDLNLLLKNEDIPKNYKNIPPHQKFLLQKKFINLLSFTVINTLFSKFSLIQINQNNKSSNKKINFNGFVYIILILSNKIFNPKYNKISFDDKQFSYDEIYDSECKFNYFNKFYSTYLKPLYLNIFPLIEEDNYTIDNLMILIKNEKIKYIVNKTIPLFIQILKRYNDNQEYVEYSDFFKCLTDFNIFPDFVQRKKMIKIFINFIKDFDDLYILKGNNKVISEIKNCAYGIIYIGLIGEDSENIRNDEPEIRLFNFIHQFAKSNNLGKISILNLKNNLQTKFLNNLYDIYNYLLKDKEIKEKKIQYNY